jgi:prepilin-type N-terminal cleavage/methylation domain-containing protein
VRLLPLVIAMNKFVGRWKSEAGYSLTEMMVVVGIAGTLSAMAVVQIGTARSGIKGDAAMRLVIAQMNQARETAITQRRNMRLVFDAGNRIQIIREEVNVVPPAPTTVTVSTVFFEGRLTFVKNITASPAGDTLDGFATSGSVNFPGAATPPPGQPPEIKFTPEGRFVNESGASLNGVVLTGIPNDALSSRGVSIMGSTGRIRGFKWDGRKWVQV